MNKNSYFLTFFIFSTTYCVYSKWPVKCKVTRTIIIIAINTEITVTSTFPGSLTNQVKNSLINHNNDPYIILKG